MKLDLMMFSYLFLRLAPFIIVSFFTLTSIFNQDLKGIIYLVGLIFSCVMSSIIYNTLPSFSSDMIVDNPICNLVSFSENHTSSAMPVGQNILGFTFFYLVYIIIKNPDFAYGNLPTLIFFPVLILFDGLWNFYNQCFNPFQLIISLGLGVGFGLLWAYIIDSTKAVNLQYFNQAGPDTCSRPAKNTFKCNVYKNGQLLQSNFK